MGRDALRIETIYRSGPAVSRLQVWAASARNLPSDYYVVMANPVSVRFQQPGVVKRLKAAAAARGESSSALAEELIDEGLRIRRHPLVTFRDGPTGRRAALA